MLSVSMRSEVLHAGAMAGLSNSRWCFFLRSRQTGDPLGHLNSTQRKSVVNFKVALDLNLHVQEVCNFIKAALHFKLERLSQRKNLNLFRRERWLEIALIHFHWLYNFDPPILVVFYPWSHRLHWVEVLCSTVWGLLGLAITFQASLWSANWLVLPGNAWYSVMNGFVWICLDLLFHLVLCVVNTYILSICAYTCCTVCTYIIYIHISLVVCVKQSRTMIDVTQYHQARDRHVVVIVLWVTSHTQHDSVFPLCNESIMNDSPV